MRFGETHKVIYVLKPADYGAGGTGESINCEGYSHLTYIIQCATFTDNSGAGADLTIKSGASDGTQTTAETFYYRIASAAQAAANADIYGAETSATTYEMLKANVDSTCLIVEVPLDGITDAQPWLTLALSSDGTAANCSCIAILSGGYQGYQPPTSL